MFQHINKVVKYMVATDFFLNSAFGSFAPVFAIFIADQVAGGSPRIAGFATSVYWIVKSVIQLPVARWLDVKVGDQGKFHALFFGYLAGACTPILYLFVKSPTGLYVVQAFLGVTMAFAIPAWYSLFTRHVDKWRVSFEWSLESVFSIGAATAISAAVGGYVAERFGFQYLFLGAGVLALLSTLLLLPLRRGAFSKDVPDGADRISPERHRKHL